jgi:hypothetical protein
MAGAFGTEELDDHTHHDSSPESHRACQAVDRHEIKGCYDCNRD